MDQIPASNSQDRSNRRFLAVVCILVVCSLLAFIYVYSLGDTDLDGDGWAHVKIARLWTDAVNPGYEQIGTVWLPLFHLLAAPLAANDYLWKTGLAGSVVSMLSFVFAGLGLYRLLTRTALTRSVVVLGMVFYLLNPSWLYYQSTPMQEPLSVALSVWNVVFLVRWQQQSRRSFLFLAGLINALAALNRYEGWVFIPFATIWILIAEIDGSVRTWPRRWWDACLYGFIASLAPLYWFAHNWFMYGDALEFVRGPYSAWALYMRQVAELHFKYPTEGHLWLSVLYFSKSMRYCGGEICFWLAVLGLGVFIAWGLKPRGDFKAGLKSYWLSSNATFLLLLVPCAFYIYALSKGRVPTYVVDYYPYQNFGVRYGHLAIPAIVMLAAITMEFVRRWLSSKLLLMSLGTVLIIGLIFPVALAIKTHLHSLPAQEEPYYNNLDDRRTLKELAEYLKPRWHGEKILMNSGYLGRIVQLDAIPLKNCFIESNLRAWEFALRYPFPRVQWVFAEEGDDVWRMIQTVPAYHRYYQEVKQVRGVRAHVIHVYRHFAGEGLR
ncbi:MAG: hypothetical protein PHX83_09610 [Acidobacteriia bacterium]|nr:hypothetical protein [Terriglobia bacterium]